MIGLNPEPRGVSLEEIQQYLLMLREADWAASDGPVRFATGLRLEDVGKSRYFVNARLLLREVVDAGKVKATVTGKLPRAMVRALFERCDLQPEYREMMVRYGSSWNEQDIWPLHLVHVLCQIAGLITLRKGSLQASPKGRRLVADDQAGELYRELFLAGFRKFDLRYDFNLRDVPTLQGTLVAILWRLDAVARDWTPVNGLAPEILLPAVLAELRAAMTYPGDTEEWILEGYVLRPLIRFGLLESRKGGEGKFGLEGDSIRTTALWRKFISFSWQLAAR